MYCTLNKNTVKEPYGFGDGAVRHQWNRFDVQFLLSVKFYNKNFFPMKPFQMAPETHFQEPKLSLVALTPALKKSVVLRGTLSFQNQWNSDLKHATWKWWQGTLQKDYYRYAWHTLIHCQEQKISLSTAGAQHNMAMVYIVNSHWVGYVTSYARTKQQSSQSVHPVITLLCS